MDSPEGIRVNP
jgi:hypothetical protein